MIENFNEKFLAFAKAKPADEGYFALPVDRCALSQFVQSQGYEGGLGSYMRGKEQYEYSVPAFFAAIDFGSGDMTWGALVERLEARGVTTL